MFAYLEGSGVGHELEDSTSPLATHHTEELVLMTSKVMHVLFLHNRLIQKVAVS